MKTDRMRTPILAVMAISLTVGACGRVAESRFNPFNWFGRESVETVAANADVTTDGRQLVDQVTELAVDQTPGGAIIRAVGLPPVQGFWDAELVRVNSADPSLAVYEFRVLPPLKRRAQSTTQSREIIAGAALSNRQLASIRGIVVRGQRSQRTVSR